MTECYRFPPWSAGKERRSMCKSVLPVSKSMRFIHCALRITIRALVLWKEKKKKKLCTVNKSAGTDCESDSTVYKPSTRTFRRTHSTVTQMLLLNLKEAFSWPPIRLHIKQLLRLSSKSSGIPLRIQKKKKRISKDVLRHPWMKWIPWVNFYKSFFFFFYFEKHNETILNKSFYKMSIKW